jgi:ABC-type Fe3+/spermidine/putrescine transport system ATPase subunit
MALSDRIVVFNKGTVQQVGTPRGVYERPANLFVADFMGLVNKLPATLLEHQGRTARVRIGGQTMDAHMGEGLDGIPGPVTLAIRPEAIRLGAANATTPGNVLNGTVAECAFLGNIVDYQIDVGGLLVRVQGDRQESYRPGTVVHMTIPVAECVAMRDDPTSEINRT